MPIHHEYETAHRILSCVTTDPVSVSDWLAVRHTVQQGGRIPNTVSRVLLDLRQRREFLPQKKLVMLINSLWRRASIPADYWIAVVVSGDLGYGIGRMIQGHAEEYEQIQVFRDLQVARQWLKVQPHLPLLQPAS